MIDVAHTVTRQQLLRECDSTDDLWPTERVPKRLGPAEARFAEYLEHEVGNL